MKCQSCGGAELVRDTRDVVHTYKTQSITIKGVTGDYCPVCHEAVMELPESERMMKEVRDFVKQVNSQSLQHDLVASVRKKLNITQKQTAGTRS
jgi:HTH-type transcriptional regulator / antitoxin MqsA